MRMNKTFDAKIAEPRVYQAWEAANAFKAGANAKPNSETYSIMIPPPNVTGSLHMGHAFNNILQDILIRWHRMRGFDTLWQPGTDHAGIATQMVTEREMAKNKEPSRTAMGRKAFEQRVWQQKITSRATIISQLKRLGASCDWSREAFTMSGAQSAPTGEEGNFHDAVIKVFVEMYNKGLVYRGKRLVNWDPHFETAISDLEVVSVETCGYMWHFKYPLQSGVTYTYVEKDENNHVIFSEERDYISIATTRPETMLGDGAVAVHPCDERYAPIVGKLCEIPVGPKEARRLIPIITDDYPDPNFGSGAVKITGAHDFNDYVVAKRNDIPCYRLMNASGKMRSDGASYLQHAKVAMSISQGQQTLNEAEIDNINLVPDNLRGLDRFEARSCIVEQIFKEGLAVMTTADNPILGTTALCTNDEKSKKLVPLVEEKPIMQPYGDRSNVIIEPMLTDQWFVDTSSIVSAALNAVKSDKIEILPDSGKKTYFHWLENIEPWCISRQLWWGHQIPVWYGPHMIENSSKPLQDRFNIAAHYSHELKTYKYDYRCAETEQEAIQAFHSIWNTEIEVVDDETAFIKAMNELKSCNRTSVPIFRDPDVLDTWFSSGLWPIGTLGWPNKTKEFKRYFPTSVLITGQDILFFWVARMIMMQLSIVNQIPFKKVYLHGLVRDENGRKMSKSLGNVVDPLEVIEEFGTDSLRFTTSAMASLGGMLKLDRRRFIGYRNFTTKLWNFAKFAELNAVFDVTANTLPQPSHTLNKWIMNQTFKTLDEVNAALETFRFNDAANILYAFVWGKVCDWYVEFSKPLFQQQEKAKLETQMTMKWVLDHCLILLHPIMPFITEEIWGLSGKRKKMLIHAEWPDYSSRDLIDTKADHEMNWIIDFIESIRSLRVQMSVPAGIYVLILARKMNKRSQKIWDNNATIIKRLARIKELVQVTKFPKGTAILPAEGAEFGLPLAELIDFNAEETRLSKAHKKLQKEIKSLKHRLSQQKFLTNAPEEVINQTHVNLAEREEKEKKINDALTRLKEMS
ncbi:MAG: valine--tRNA ligase [Aestuariivita sp.]|nr:valine--tRNA ligase [Aestuariivita sp.]